MDKDPVIKTPESQMLEFFDDKVTIESKVLDFYREKPVILSKKERIEHYWFVRTRQLYLVMALVSFGFILIILGVWVG